eukprot:6477336-Amphidinium_carterae.1
MGSTQIAENIPVTKEVCAANRHSLPSLQVCILKSSPEETNNSTPSSAQERCKASNHKEAQK